ncbi:hypothetical protein E2320_011999, partial [Naja naja]
GHGHCGDHRRDLVVHQLDREHQHPADQRPQEQASPFLCHAERMLRLIDCATKTSEDYAGYNDTVCLCRFAPSGKRLFTASYNEILVWEVQS